MHECVSVPYSCLALKKLEFGRQILVKILNIKFAENVMRRKFFLGGGGAEDRPEEMTKLKDDSCLCTSTYKTHL
jgi:hypothetical protein